MIQKVEKISIFKVLKFKYLIKIPAMIDKKSKKTLTKIN